MKEKTQKCIECEEEFPESALISGICPECILAEGLDPEGWDEEFDDEEFD